MKVVPWVTGLRQPNTTQDPVAAILLRICCEVGKEEPGVKTAEAEAGLDYPPSCYWFIGRADSAFSYAIFFWTDGGVVWTDDDGAVCPFDTGGVWHQRIDASPKWTSDEERTAFVRQHQARLDGWSLRFELHIEQNYAANVARYIEGERPMQGNPVIATVVSNQARAWTWEARVVRPQAHHVRPVRLVIEEDVRQRVFKSLPDVESDTRRKHVSGWLRRHLEVCDLSTTIYDRAVELLKEEVA